MIRTVHTAKFVLAEAGMLLRNAAVHVSDPGRISRLEPWQGPPARLETRVIDWGPAIILPGLVNTHSHLELTRLHGSVNPGHSFTGWLSALMTEMQSRTKEDYLESAARGAHLSLSSGTTLVGDISASGLSWEALKPEKLRKVVFEEVTGFLPGKAGEALSNLKARLERHAAETKQELEFLASGSGEFKDFLSALGVLPAGWLPPQMAPIPYLDQLGLLDRPALLVHCNYLDEDSKTRILSRNCSVVCCPRSHAYFGHELHPVRELLDMGINVDEMRFLFRNRKDLKCDEIIRMATLNGAVALDFGGVLGRLRRGYWADMTVLRLPDSVSDRNVEAQILEGAGECLATIVQGEIVWTKAQVRKKMMGDD
jgi:cytosine/adenosine deaminase-related metal-dependent hydrolase